jgi:anti-sigma regulatory factor (Ser/Thr protein kinase)
MTATRSLNMAFPADFASVDQARNRIQILCRDVFPTSTEAVTDFCLAINEAMNNAVEHSGCPVVEIELQTDESSMTFRMRTSGKRFDPTRKASFPELDEQKDLPEGGYGLALIQAFVDRLDYEYRDGKNTLTLIKNIHNGGTNCGD